MVVVRPSRLHRTNRQRPDARRPSTSGLTHSRPASGRSCCKREALVPTLCVGMHVRTLCVLSTDNVLIGRDAERPDVHSHAERGNEGETARCTGRDAPIERVK